MGIEPYRRRASAYDEGTFTENRTWGDPLQTPDPAPPGRQARARGSNALVLRARRARTDPDWSTYSREKKRRLIAHDRKMGL